LREKPGAEQEERGKQKMTPEKICSNGYDHNPLWKPLYWKLYYQYIPLEDFKREYPTIWRAMERQIRGKKIVKTDHYLYKEAGKTRKVIHRIRLLDLHLANKKLYEKTPSERGQKDPFQRRLEGEAQPK